MILGQIIERAVGMVQFAEVPTEGALRFGAAAQQEEASEDGSVYRL